MVLGSLTEVCDFLFVSYGQAQHTDKVPCSFIGSTTKDCHIQWPHSSHRPYGCPKLSFFLSDLNNNFLNYTSVLSLQPTLLSTLALFLTNTFSPTKSLHFLNPATITSSTSLYPPISRLQNSYSRTATSIVHSKLEWVLLPRCMLRWQLQATETVFSANCYQGSRLSRGDRGN